ncbi:hypothetical protein PN441_06535 [Spirulina major CS-329]|nr:hypothetical protein [Spirulina major]MDB9494625.1 hypothetical protein [Spirulina subsalsa CS-330]MDB9502725.1 hypothetical protein [Spirulina major CS-329]
MGKFLGGGDSGAVPLCIGGFSRSPTPSIRNPYQRGPSPPPQAS